MSVPLSRRSPSSMEFFHNAIKIRREFTRLLLKDFGIKPKIRNLDMVQKMYKMDDEDKGVLQSILEKYDMETRITDEYPEWLIDEFRGCILHILRELMLNLKMANSIYITTKEEYSRRRELWTNAVGNCEQLLDEMQYIIDILDVDAEKYMRYVEMLEKEVALIKGVRKADNKSLKNI